MDAVNIVTQFVQNSRKARLVRNTYSSSTAVDKSVGNYNAARGQIQTYNPGTGAATRNTNFSTSNNFY